MNLQPTEGKNVHRISIAQDGASGHCSETSGSEICEEFMTTDIHRLLEKNCVLRDFVFICQ
jgi:hypothetical protein